MSEKKYCERLIGNPDANRMADCVQYRCGLTGGLCVGHEDVHDPDSGLLTTYRPAIAERCHGFLRDGKTAVDLLREGIEKKQGELLSKRKDLEAKIKKIDSERTNLSRRLAQPRAI